MAEETATHRIPTTLQHELPTTEYGNYNDMEIEVRNRVSTKGRRKSLSANSVGNQ